MSTTLFDSAPGFDQPIAVLKHCHDRIRKQLRTLEALPAHVAQHGADAEAQAAAAAVLKYFIQAAPNHHADEEQDLLPMLQETARGEDAALLAEKIPLILAQHAEMHEAWHRLESPLQEIAAGRASEIAADEAGAYAAAYTAHMEIEESHIAPMAKRIFSAEQMTALGAAMRARRGIADGGDGGAR